MNRYNRMTHRERWLTIARLIAKPPRDWTDEDDRGPYDRKTADYYNHLDDETAPMEASK